MPTTLATTRTIIQGIPMSHIAIALSALMFMVVIPAIFEPKKFREAVDDFLNAGNTVFRLSALFDLLIAFFILNTHWTIKLSSSRSIMTALGYLLVVRGLVRLWFPDFARSMIRKLIHKEYGVPVMAIVGFLFAVGLGYLGIWVY